jgi:hypothetical protein
MWVKQLIGNRAGELVEMPHAEGRLAIDNGTAAAPSEEELVRANSATETLPVERSVDQVTAGYTISPHADGGFIVLDPGGVPLFTDQAPFHNHLQAKEAVAEYARGTVGLPPLERGEDGNPIDPALKVKPVGQGPDAATPANGGEPAGGEPVDYETNTVAQLKELAERRKVTVKGAKKDDFIDALKRHDTVTEARAKGDWDVLHKDELELELMERNIDLPSSATKEEMIVAIKAHKAS